MTLVCFRNNDLYEEIFEECHPKEFKLPITHLPIFFLDFSFSFGLRDFLISTTKSDEMSDPPTADQWVLLHVRGNIFSKADDRVL